MHLGARGFVHPELIDPGTGEAVPMEDGATRRARAHAPEPPRRAAPALPHARPRGRPDEPVRVRPHRAAHPLHRAHRRHADRARRERVPVGDPRGRRRVSRRTSAVTSSSGRPRPGVKQEPPLPVAVELARDGRRQRRLAEAIRGRLRDVLVVQTQIELVPWGTLAAERVQVEAGRAIGGHAEASEPGRPPHHDRRRRPADVDRLLGGRARHAVRVRAAEPRQRRPRATSTSTRATAA